MKTKQAAELYLGSVAHGLPLKYGYTDDRINAQSQRPSDPVWYDDR
jgi:hypothetical protein